MKKLPQRGMEQGKSGEPLPFLFLRFRLFLFSFSFSFSFSGLLVGQFFVQLILGGDIVRHIVGIPVTTQPADAG